MRHSAGGGAGAPHRGGRPWRRRIQSGPSAEQSSSERDKLGLRCIGRGARCRDDHRFGYANSKREHRVCNGRQHRERATGTPSVDQRSSRGRGWSCARPLGCRTSCHRVRHCPRIRRCPVNLLIVGFSGNLFSFHVSVRSRDSHGGRDSRNPHVISARRHRCGSRFPRERRGQRERPCARELLVRVFRFCRRFRPGAGAGIERGADAAIVPGARHALHEQLTRRVGPRTVSGRLCRSFKRSDQPVVARSQRATG